MEVQGRPVRVKSVERPGGPTANLDDLGEYRPGLDTAREHGVRHPYIEAGIDKATIRALARELGLGAIAELPTAPCLSSRVKTGIRIHPETLRFVDRVENLVGERLGPGEASRAVRCRVRRTRVAIELDSLSLDALDEVERCGLQQQIAAEAPPGLAGLTVSFRAL